MELRWITLLECSIYFSLHLMTTYARIAKGEIPVVRVGIGGSSIRIDQKKLDEQLENQILDLENKAKDWDLIE